ncbi:MAG TPA: glycosyltransferase family 39 protein [Acidobacteriaceae bacterium]|nr:glycosyltransferase family 39 protein [Acidobacteriaceae bacterium]
MFPLILAFYLFVLKRERLRPLWHDELYTYYIAQAPTFGRMIHWTRTLDLNPPLYYILDRAIFHFLHPGQLSARLPSMAGYLVALVCVYLFVRRLTTPLHGWLAALILLGSSFTSYSFEARPYALVFGFLGVAAIGWQSSVEERRRGRSLALLLLLFGAFGMLLSHVLALIAYGAFFFAECIRFAIRRKPDWALWTAMVLPLISYLTYRPLLQNHGSSSFPVLFQASAVKLVNAYSVLWMDVAPLLALAMLLAIWLDTPATRQPRRVSIHAHIPELSFAIGLLAVPFIVTLLFMRSHSAYFPRYGMNALFGVAILVPSFVAWWKPESSRVALIFATVFVFGVISPNWFAVAVEKYVYPGKHRLKEATTLSKESYRQIEPALPFVDASGLAFLEMNNREPADFLSRVYYLSYPEAAIQYAHASIFEGLANLKYKFPIQDNVEPYQQFIRQHHRFLVFGTYTYPEDWLLRKLMADGATLKFLGDFSSTYDDHELYEVTLPGPMEKP